MAKSFTADIGNVSFPQMRFTEVQPNTSGADLAKNLTGIALDVDQKMAESDLIGKKPDERQPLEIAGVEVPAGGAMPEKDVLSMSKEVEGELNLRKIKRMREQGTLSAGGAKILAAQAVQSASARRPGLAAEFRKTAATFFGDFGEGQDLLSPSAEEKEKDKLTAQLKSDAIRLGFATVTAQGTVDVSPQQMELTRSFAIGETQRTLEKGRFESAIRAGQVGAANLDSYARNISTGVTATVLGRINAQVTKDGALMKPEQLAFELSNGEFQVSSQVNKEVAKLRSQGAIIDSKQAQEIQQSALEQFRRTAEFMKSQSFATIMKDKRDGFANYLAIKGFETMPITAMAEQVAPGAGKEMHALEMRLGNMTAKERERLFALDPNIHAQWTAIEQAKFVSGALTNVLKGIVPDKLATPTDYKSSLFVATDMASRPGGKEDENTQKSIDWLLQGARKGDAQTLWALADRKIKPNLTPQGKKEFMNSVLTESSNILLNVPNLLEQYNAYDIVFDGTSFTPVLSERGKEVFSYELSQLKHRKPGVAYAPTTAPGMGSLPSEIKIAVQSMNTVLRALKNYKGDGDAESVLRSDPYFKEVFAGRTEEEVADALLSKVKENKTKLSELRAKNKVTLKGLTKEEETALKKQEQKAEGIE